MAKKRIAADVDLCGNSVENVKNVTASGTVKANTLDGKSNYVDCGVLSKDGWYRFASSPQLSGQTDAIFSVGHFYNNNIAENYLIAVSISYEGFATISQLSGSNAYGLHQIISKVRVVWSISGYHIDFQVSKSVGAGNKFFISQFGGIFDVFEATAAPEPTSSDKVTELSLVNGMTCSEGFKGNVVGDVTGNVVGNVTGELTGTLGGRVAALPSYNSGDLGLTTSVTADEYIQALLKKLVSEHSNLLGMTLIGKTEPNSQRNVILYTYPSEVLNGMPKFCSGVMYTGSTGEVYRFWVRDGVFVGKIIVSTAGDLIGARTDHNGNTIATTYATKSEVNNISETYAKKSDLSKYVTGEDYSNHLQAADKKYATKDELQEGTYTEGDGIEISTDKVISVKKDSSSESFLSVGADGVKVSGVQTAIDNAKIAVIGKQGNNSAMNTVFGAKKYTDEKVQAVSSDVTSLEGRVSTNETDISNLRSSLNEAITDFQQDYDGLGEEVGDIRNDYTALDGKIDTTKSELIGNSSATTTSGATIYDTRRYAASLFDNLGNTYTTKNELGALKGTVDSHNEGLNKCVQDISALNTRTTDVEDKTSKLTADGSEFKGKVYYDRHGDDICETYLRKDDLTEGDGIELSDTYEISLALADANKGDQTEGYLVFEQGKLATRGIDDAIADAVDEAKTDLSSSFATKSQYNSLNSQVQAQQTHISTLMNERVSVLGGRTGAYTGPTSGTHIWGFVSSGSVNLQSSGVTSGTRLTVATAVSSVTIKRSDGGTIFNSGSGGVTSIIVPGYSFAECIYMNGLWIVKI